MFLSSSICRMVDLFICLLTPSSSDNVQPRYVMLYQKSQSDATDKNWRSPRSRRPDVERRIRPERTWHRFRKSEIHSAPKRLEFRKKKKPASLLMLGGPEKSARKTGWAWCMQDQRGEMKNVRTRVAWKWQKRASGRNNYSAMIILRRLHTSSRA